MNDHQANELRDCPFCGGEAQTDFIEGESYLIECYICRAETGIKDSEAEAIAAWNRRAAPTSQAAVDRDAVVEAARSLVAYLDANPPMGDSIWSVKQLRAALAAPAAPAVPQKPYLSHFATLNEYKAAQAVYEAATAQPSPSMDQAKRLVGGEVADINAQLTALRAGLMALADEIGPKAMLRTSVAHDRTLRASTGSATSTADREGANGKG